MQATPLPSRIVADEALRRVSRATLAYVRAPTRRHARAYDVAFANLRVALKVLASQSKERAA